MIENSIMSYYKTNYMGLIPHLATITKLSILGVVNGDWEDEESSPKASPLTLIGVTKGSKNIGKEKEMETKEEEENERENEPVQWESPAQEQQEMQRSLSPIWNVSPYVRETHQEPAKSLGQ